MKTWDVIIIGGGIIGLSLARELHKSGFKVLILERGAIGREASHAAAGMLADGAEIPDALKNLAHKSAKMYPEFAAEVRDESGINPDLRDYGTIWFLGTENHHSAKSLSPTEITQLEPDLAPQNRSACFLEERSVDPRLMTEALHQAAKHRQIDIASGSEVVEVLVDQGRIQGVRTNKTSYLAAKIVNCAGAWAGSLLARPLPVRPVKGQMLCITGANLQHVVRAPEVYLVPRSDGRIVIGSTLEEAGFDKRTDAETIRGLHQAALTLLPTIKNARIHDSWAGLRPATTDGLPILGETITSGYFIATGHFRDGILLAPVTAEVMAQLISGKTPDTDLAAFSPQRYS